jgi:WD40 repeat protein
MYAYAIGNTIRFFNVSKGELISEFSDSVLSREKSLTFQGNDIIAITRNSQMDTFEIATGEWVHNYPHLGYCSFNQTGTTVICTYGDFELYEASTGRALIKIRPERSYRYAVSDDGAYTAFCNYGSETVFLYDNQNGTQIQFLKMNNQPACGSMDFSDDGQLLVSSIGAVWEIPSGDLVMEIGSLGYGSISISPNIEFVLAYPGIYSLEDGSMLSKIEADIGWVQSAWFLPDGFNIVILGENSLQFWGVLE